MSGRGLVVSKRFWEVFIRGRCKEDGVWVVRCFVFVSSLRRVKVWTQTSWPSTPTRPLPDETYQGEGPRGNLRTSYWPNNSGHDDRLPDRRPTSRTTLDRSKTRWPVALGGRSRAPGGPAGSEASPGGRRPRGFHPNFFFFFCLYVNFPYFFIKIFWSLLWLISLCVFNVQCKELVNDTYSMKIMDKLHKILGVWMEFLVHEKCRIVYNWRRMCVAYIGTSFLRAGFTSNVRLY